jgi:hypothetical protein
MLGVQLQLQCSADFSLGSGEQECVHEMEKKNLGSWDACGNTLSKALLHHSGYITVAAGSWLRHVLNSVPNPA